MVRQAKAHAHHIYGGAVGETGTRVRAAAVYGGDRALLPRIGTGADGDSSQGLVPEQKDKVEKANT